MKPMLRGEKYYVKIKEETGRWHRRATSATSLRDAERIRIELQLQADRRREGLEPIPARVTMTLGQLMSWWLETYSKPMASHRKTENAVRNHVLNFRDLADLPLKAVTPGKIESFLQAKGLGGLGPKTVNNLRGYVASAYTAAIAAEKWAGENPALKTKKRKVPKRAPEFLRFDEVPPLLTALSPRWRPLFAVAIYAGLRKGELLALRKEDVDLGSLLLRVAHSNDRDTTKGGHGDYIPINRELVPYLETALGESESELVFPGPDGKLQTGKTKLEMVLRRAMARAGIVNGYDHICRRKGCGEVVKANDDAERRCPKCDFLLWSRPLVRKIRFHDVRHTTASLSLMSGVQLVAVQALLRHDDPKTTMSIYGHLANQYLSAEVDKLSFAPQLSSGEEASPVSTQDFGPPVVQMTENQKTEAGVPVDFSKELRPLNQLRGQDLNLRPSGYEPDELPGCSTPRYVNDSYPRLAARSSSTVSAP